MQRQRQRQRHEAEAEAEARAPIRVIGLGLTLTLDVARDMSSLLTRLGEKGPLDTGEGVREGVHCESVYRTQREAVHGLSCSS